MIDPISGAIMGGANLIGGLLGAEASREEFGRAERAMNEAYSIIASLGLPPDESKALILEKFKQAGIYTPQLEENLAQLPDSAFEQIQLDPRAKEAQLEALKKLQEIGRVGFGAQERAALAEAQDQAAREEQGKRQQILQDMQQRGLGGSGAELATQIAAQQSGANRGSLDALRVGGMAAQRVLEGARMAGTLGGQMEQQEYKQLSDLAGRKDYIKEFNTKLSNDAKRRNVGIMNEALLANLRERQRIDDANILQGNVEQQRQSIARQQNWHDQAMRNQLLANARMGQAGIHAGRGTRQGQAMTGLFQSIGQIGGNLYAGGAFKGSPDVTKQESPYQLPTFTAQPGYSASAGRYGSNISEFAHGGMVPGEAHVPGDHPMNDTVDAKLSPEEIVIPRSITEHPNAPDRAAGYIQALLSLKNKGK